MLLKSHSYIFAGENVYLFKIEKEVLLAKNQITENTEYTSSVYIWKLLKKSLEVLPYTFSLEISIKNKVVNKKENKTYRYDIVSVLDLYQDFIKINLEVLQE